METKTSLEMLRIMMRREYTIPTFQRKLVWTADQVLSLVKSASDGYPIGPILLWEKTYNDIVILDGQQRFSALTGMVPGSDEIAPHQVGWDFSRDEWVINSDSDSVITLNDWLTSDFAEKLEMFKRIGYTLGEEYLPGLQKLDDIELLLVAIYTLTDATREEAVRSFYLLNSKGTRISEEELSVLIQNKERA